MKNEVSALILAGGRGQRLGGADKGLALLAGRPLVAWVCDALLAQTTPPFEILISANRHPHAYAAFAARVLEDQRPDYPGPLAGIEAGLSACRTPWLLVTPCDVPRLPDDLLARLLAAVQGSGQGRALAAYAVSDGRSHPALCLLSVSLLPSLRARLDGGNGRLQGWLDDMGAAPVAFDAQPFENLNTAEDIHAMTDTLSDTGLTHFNAAGQAHMVNVGGKTPTQRVARATGNIHMRADTLARIAAGEHAKGDVLGIARIAAIMGAKRTADLIPLCHPLPLSGVAVDFRLDAADNRVHCDVTASTFGVTGVEMEALTAVQVALLTIYDMCKAVDKGMTMDGVRLLEKTGGKSGHWRADAG